jgi:predicted Zn-dependent protease
MLTVLTVSAALAIAAPAHAQLGGKLGQRIKDAGDKAKDAKDKVDKFIFTDAEEHQLGSEISTMLRDKYGVVQDKAVHKYVTLVGTVLAQASSRPGLGWTFVVLDTDGVNAFAAPGGFIHITRGALALIQDEAELADVLGHEISHVTAKHTINAIKKANAAELAGEQARQEFINQVANKAYGMILENKFDRGDEMDADKNGVTLANAAGYAPNGLSAFLNRLSERNKDLKDRSGLFASHPETKARLDGLGKVIASAKLTAAATVAARFRQAINYKPVPVTQIATAADGSAAAPAEPKPTGGKFGLSGMNPLGKEKTGSQTVASAGSRGVNPDRDAKGGPNKAIVAVTVSAGEVAEFKKGIV